jgi:hypothetical protein
VPAGWGDAIDTLNRLQLELCQEGDGGSGLLPAPLPLPVLLGPHITAGELRELQCYHQQRANRYRGRVAVLLAQLQAEVAWAESPPPGSAVAIDTDTAPSSAAAAITAAAGATTACFPPIFSIFHRLKPSPIWVNRQA